jgi:hypothetical protein
LPTLHIIEGRVTRSLSKALALYTSTADLESRPAAGPGGWAWTRTLREMKRAQLRLSRMGKAIRRCNHRGVLRESQNDKCDQHHYLHMCCASPGDARLKHQLHIFDTPSHPPPPQPSLQRRQGILGRSTQLLNDFAICAGR